MLTPYNRLTEQLAEAKRERDAWRTEASLAKGEIVLLTNKLSACFAQQPTVIYGPAELPAGEWAVFERYSTGTLNFITIVGKVRVYRGISGSHIAIRLPNAQGAAKS